MNADGIYLTTYRVIHLNVKLKKEGHYGQNQEDRFPSISEKEFVESILESGILIYLSSIWLAEVYSIVTRQDLFEGCTVASPIIHLCSGNICKIKKDLFYNPAIIFRHWWIWNNWWTWATTYWIQAVTRKTVWSQHIAKYCGGKKVFTTYIDSNLGLYHLYLYKSFVELSFSRNKIKSGGISRIKASKIITILF